MPSTLVLAMAWAMAPMNAEAQSYSAGGGSANVCPGGTWSFYGNPGVAAFYDDTDVDCAIAIGDGAGTISNSGNSHGLIAIGAGSTAESTGTWGAVALGTNAYAVNSGVAIGAHSISSGGSAFAVGRQSAAEGQYSLALGRVSYAQGAASMAIGVNSNAQGARAIAIGGRNESGDYDAATQTRANGTDAIAIGGGASRGAQAQANNTIAIGQTATSSGVFDVALGFEATAASGLGTRGAIALGDQTLASGQQAAAIGSRARVTASQGIAIGNDTSAIGYAAVAIGGDDLDGADSTFVDFIADKGWLYQQNDDSIDPLTGTGTPSGFLKSQARELGSTVVGTSSVAYAVGSTVVGTASLAEGEFSTAIGTMNHAEGQRSLAIGAESYAAGIRSMATGSGATASADFSMAVGNFSEATGRNSAAVGNSSDALGVGASAFGNFAIADGASATALGGGGVQGSFQGAQATADGATAIGGNTVRGALAEGVNSIAVGGESTAGGVDAIAIGTGATASGDQSISIGLGNQVSGTGSGAVGDPNIINGSGSYALGNDNTIDADEAGTFGNDNVLGATATGSRIIGNSNGDAITPIAAADAFILGNDANVTVDGGVAIGSGTLADTDSGVAGYDPLSGAPSTDIGSTWLSTASAISVGDAANDLTRQITGVAAGAAETDAVNVAQLQALGDTPLTFAGDSGTDVERQLGETLNINGGATGTLTSGNIGVVGDGTDTLEIQLAENVDLGAAGSVTTGNSTLDNDGLAIDDGVGNVTNVTATGTEVDDGTGNVASYAATGSEVTDGTNTTTTTAADTTYDDGAGNTSVASADGISVTDGITTTDVTSDGLTISGGPSVTTGGIDAGSQVISNVSDGVADNDAVNVSQLDAVETIANTGWNLTAEGVNGTNVAPGDTVDLSNTDGNLVIAKNAADGAQEDVTFDLADDLAVDSVTTGNSVLNNAGLAIDDGAGNVTNLTNDGLTIAGGPSITASGGIDANDQVISSVGAGEVSGTSTDAINGSQLFGSVDSINTVIGGNSVVNADGTITTSDIGNTGQDTVHDAIDSVNTAANAGWNVTDGTNAANIGPGGNVTFSGDANIDVAQSGVDDDGQIDITLAPDLNVDSVTTGNSVLDTNGLAIDDGSGNVTNLTNDGLTITGGPSITASGGIDANDQVISSVGAGEVSGTSTDAINGSQLFGSVDSINTVIGGNSVVNADGTITTSDIGNTGQDTVHDAIDSVNTAANAGWNVTDGTNAANIGPGGNVTFSGDANIDVAQSGVDDAGQIDITLAPDLNVDSVTTGNSVLDTNGLAIDDGAGNVASYAATGSEVTDGTDTTSTTAGGISVTDGATTTDVTNDGLTIAGGPSITASGGIDANDQVISSVGAGEVSGTSTDAINGSQLFGSVDSINTVIGGNSVVNADGTITTSDIGNTGQDTVHDAIDSVNTAANAGWNVTDGTTAANIGPGGNVTFSGDANIDVAQSGVDDAGQIDITLAPDLNVDSVTTGNSVLDTNGLAIDDGAGNVTNLTNDGLTIAGGPSITASGGIDANDQVISSVGAGEVSGTSTDAINGSQLFGSVDSINTVIGGNSVVNADGTITTSDIGNTGQDTVHDAIDSVNTAANAGWNVTDGTTAANIGPDGNVTFSGDANIDVAQSGVDDDGQIDITLAPDLNVDSVTTGNSVLDTNGLAIDDGAGNVTNLTNDGLTITGGPSITASGGIDANDQVISSVGAGDVSGTSTDAINGSQLFGSVDSINTVIGGNSIVNADGTITTSDIGNTGQDTVHDAIDSVNTAANAGWNVTDGTNAANIGPGGNVTFSGDANIDVAQSGVDDDGQIDITLAPDLNVDSVTTGNSTLNNDGLTIVGGPSITNSGGIDAGNQVISNVAGPVNGGDAVNLTYFNENRTRYYSVNDGNTARDNFENDGATGLFSMATGIGARAMSEDAVALGRDSESMILGSVALGSDSVASRATAPTSGTLPAGSAAITFNTTDRDLMGAISVGHDSAYRQVTNVADGTQSQDAVTIRQLQGAIGSASVTDTRYFHANSTAGDSLAVGQESIAVGPLTIVNGDNGIGMGNQALVEATAPGGMALGQQATVTLADAVAMGTQASATGEQALALGAGATAGQAGSIALGGNSVTQAAQATSGVTLQGVTYSFAGQNPFATLSIGDDGLERTVTNMAAGRIEADSTDGINGSQLYTTNLVLEELGDAFTLVSGDTSETFTETNGTGIRYVRTNESGIDESDAFAQAPRATAVGYEALASADESLAMGYRAVASHQGSVALGAGAQTSAAVGTQSVTIAGRTYQFAGTQPVATVSVGSTGAERTITHVAAGRLSPNSTDAVNGSQLHATNQAVNAVEGRIDGVEGDVSQLGDRVTLVEGDVANLGDNVDALNDQAVKYDTNEDGSVDYETITLAGDAGTTITNVADGDISENSVDAVNGGQLWDLQDQVTNIEQGGSKYFSANSDGPAAEAQGGDSIAMGSGSVAQGDRSVAAGDGARAEVEGGVALGADSVADREGMNGQRERFSDVEVASSQGAVSVGSQGNERQITNVAGGTEATDAVNVRQLESVQAGAVNYDRNEDGSVDYSSVTLGREGTPTRMRNVAPGVDATDAANVGQLQELGQRFASELDGVNGRIDRVERNANAGAASAIAAASVPQAFMPGKSMVSVGAGTYSGESAVSVGVSRLSDNGRWVIKLNATGDSQSNFGAGVGAGWHW
ncbi:YadA-like family protein [Halomonas urumqiensis]|nr:YadA-like family protein [Halomonas urumqiensis]